MANEADILKILEPFKGVNASGKMPKDVQHFSFWSFELATCHKKWYNTVLRKMRGPAQDARNHIGGSTGHNTIERVLKSPRPKVSDLIKWWPGEFNKLCRESEILKWKSPTDKKELREQIAKQMEFVKDFFIKIELLKGKWEIRPEASFKAQIAKDCYITGRVDCWLINKETGHNVILDWKFTKSTRWLKKDQILFYALAALALTGKPVDFGAFVVPSLEDAVVHELTSSDYLNFITKVQQKAHEITHCIKERIFVKNMSEQNCKFCPFTKECGVPPTFKVPSHGGVATF